MGKIAFVFCLLTGALGSPKALARVFDFKEESFAVYFRGTGGPSLLKDQSFRGAFDPSDVTLSSKAQYNLGGELGVLWALFPQTQLRLGFEALQVKPAREAPGISGGGQTLLTLDSEVLLFHPNAVLEVNLIEESQWRAFLLGGSGWGMVHLTNDFALTSAGEVALGKDSFIEKSLASAWSWQAGLGGEWHFTDTSTVQLEAGYRSLLFSSLKLKSAVDSLAQGPTAAGETLLSFDGETRGLNLSGLYISFSFRFYIKFI